MLNDGENTVSNALKRPLSIKVEYSEGITWEYHFYYSNNLITKITDGFGSGSEFIYDSNGRLTSRTWKSGIQINYFYSGDRLSFIKSKLLRATNVIYIYSTMT